MLLCVAKSQEWKGRKEKRRRKECGHGKEEMRRKNVDLMFVLAHTIRIYFKRE